MLAVVEYATSERDCGTSFLRYDWSIVSKVAEDHLLDRVIGRHMGCEFVDVFSSLLSRNMKNVLSSILAMLGDMDLIRYERSTRDAQPRSLFLIRGLH